MGRKKGGGARTPNIEKDTLHSAQKIKVVDLVSSGEIHGFINGNDDPLKSIYLNGTPIQNNDGSLNFSGIRAEFNAGEEDQDYLASFTSSDRSIEVAARVKKDVPVTRTVYNKQVTSLRVTVGVDALMRSTKEGDQLKTHVDMSVSLIKDGNYYTSKIFSLNEKGSKPFYHDLVFDDLPEAPFDIKCTRITPDSTDDLLRNDTYFFSYVESIDAKMRYPLSAVVGLEVDSAQFGNNLPVRTYGIKGCEVLVPSNYDPVTREYSGLWDRLFKPAYTNNPVWVLYDLLTNPIDGFGSRDLKIDIDKFYEASKYCDELVDDGNGKKEPRFVCNAVIQGGKAYDVINNVCSSFRAVPAYNGEYFTIYYDRAHDVTAIYNNSNVVDGMFTYSSTDRTEQYNQVQVQFADEENGYETTIEEVADDRHIAKHGINTLSIVAFGATKRSYALRTAWWNLVTNLTEKEIVTFKTGAQGIKHEIYDIIQIADNDYVGESMGARIADIDGVKITLDRDIQNVKKLVIDTKDGIKTIDVKRQLSGREFELAIAPNIVESAPCTAILDHVNARLFRCTSIAENDDGTFTITAIQHNAQKEAIVDKGATYIPENSTTINPTPSLSNGVADNDGRAIILRWDAMTVVGADNTYRIQLFKDKVLYQTFETKETFLELENLPQGEYVAKIRAVNSNGQHSEELVIAFSTTYKIDGLRVRSIVFGIELHWQLPALITTDAHTEIWYSDVDDRQTATKLAMLTYPQNSYTLNGLSVGDEFYFWFRLVDVAGNQGEFSHSILGKPSDNADDILGYLDGKISEKQISKDLKDQFDKNIDDKIKEAEDLINDSIEKIEVDNEKLGLNIEKLNVDDILKDITLSNEGKTRYSQDSKLEANVADAFAQIKETNDVIVDETSALARKDTELEASIRDNKSEINEIKVTQVDDRKSVAIIKDEVKVQFEKNEADATLTLISLATESETRSQQDLMLSANVADAFAQIKETNTVIVNKTEALAQKDSEIESKVGENSAEIKRVDQAFVDEQKSQAVFKEDVKTRFDENEADATLSLISLSTESVTRSQQDLMLSANVADAHAEIEETKNVIAEEKNAQAEINTTLTSRIDSNVAEINQVKATQVDDQKAVSALKSETSARFDKNEADQVLENISLATEGYSRASQYSVISVTVAGNSSSIEELSNTFSNFDGTMSEKITQLQSKTDSHQSQITQISSTQAKTDGKVDALWTLKVDANGAVGGIMLGSDGKESQLKFAADSFIVSTGNQDKNLFAIQRVNGRDVAFLNTEDFILKGSLSADRIAADTFKGYKFEGVEINAGHFYGGNISIGGTKSNPNFSVDSNGNLIAKSGRFEGTVYADKIEGDVVKVIFGSENEDIAIPPANFRRRLILSEGFVSGGFKWNNGGITPHVADIYINGSRVKRVTATIQNGTTVYTPISYTRTIGRNEAITIRIHSHTNMGGSGSASYFLMPHFLLFKY